MKDSLKALWGTIMAYPDSLEDYVGVGRWLIYKKLVILFFILPVIASGVITWWIVKPEKPFEVPAFFQFEDKLKTFSGEAVLWDQTKAVVYRGKIDDGLRSGQGKEFVPPNETLVYEGEFLNDVYSGQGKLYKKGDLIYEGGFSEGKYSGSGTLLKKDQVVYQGQFVEGLYHGRGVLFDDGKKLYEGDFAAGLYEGTGTLYDKDEAVVYTGGFARGVYSGFGVQTTVEGVPIYEGTFQNGLYHGTGSLYSDDGIRLRFQGNFVGGIPGRSGGIYNERGQLLYSGNVYNGKVDYIAALGLPVSELLKMVKELPVIYYGNGYVGYLYNELGFVAIAQYDYTEFQDNNNFFDEDSALGDPAEKTALFAQLADNLVANTLLIDGTQFYDQIPITQGTEVEKQGLSGFEGFMESRLANMRVPGYQLDFPAQTMMRGDHLYEVLELPESIEYKGAGVYLDSVYYFYRADSFEKGNIPQVIFCSKAKFGG